MKHTYISNFKITSFYKPYLLSVFLLVFLGSCNNNKQKTKEQIADSLKKEAIQNWNKTIPGNFNTPSELVFDSIKIQEFIVQYPDFKPYQDSLQKFYQHRNYSFAWFNKSSLIEQAGNLADRVLNLKNEGLDKEIPYDKVLDSLLYNVDNEHVKKPDTQLELMLTAQYFVFAKIAWGGMDASVSKSDNWYLPRKKVSYQQYLDSLVKGVKKDVITEPVYRQYELLRNFLVVYRKLEQTDKWNKIIADKKAYNIGDSSVVIAQIKRKLFKLKDFSGDTLNNVYEESFAKAIKQFQYRHGLPDDGVIGAGTISELNVSLNTRIKQLMVNMERCRWLPVGLNSDYLGINIPEFKLHVYHADSLLWSCNVVVGKAVHKTVVFSGEVKYVVFSPYWNIPPSIVKNEILPGMNKNSNYLSDHRMQIIGKADGLPTIRQLPGPQNSLGLVKFLFPNSYNIYLHDSPAKSLFNESSRAFSHGCIRVSEPAKLASFLLKNNKDWDEGKIKIAMNKGKEQYVTLKEKVPVFIAYFTAFTDRNNLLNFRKDIYSRDDELAKMILK